MLALVMLLACTDDVGLVEGTVLIGPGTVGPPLSDGTITILGDEAEFFDSAETDRDGRFTAMAPKGLNIFAVVEGLGMTPAVFSGSMGQGTFVIEPGTLFGWPNQDRDALDAAFAGCSRPGAVMTGEVRLFGATDPETGESPLLQTAFAWAENAAGDRFDACYLDAEGVWAPEAEMAGPDARYAIFGLEPGFYELVYGYYVVEDFPLEHRLTLYVQEDSIVPQYPAWAELYAP